MRRGTYSIVARDPHSGELGVAVQSHWFAVGAVVAWARPGVGAVATQALAEVAHGPGVLDALAAGQDAAGALSSVLASDALAAQRQVGVVDAGGGVAVHTGEQCIPFAGDQLGEQFSCQANMMGPAGVPGAMAGAFREREGDLAERLLGALDAAQAHGGDVRGTQSAAVLVVPAAGEPWRTRFDVRVDDHADPLGEARRLLRLARAYEMAEQADERLGEGLHAQAGELYLAAARLAPEADELSFWAGVGLAREDPRAGVELVRGALAVKPSWLELLERLSPQMVPEAASLLDALREQPRDDRARAAGEPPAP